MYKYFSSTLKRNQSLGTFLTRESQVAGMAVAGWGHKPTADKARRYAARHNLPYIALEDGFLRSLDVGCKGVQPLSLVVDHTGIYYDAGEPSDLENLLNASGWETPELMDSARRAMRDIIRHNLSKYNHAPHAPERIWGDVAAPRVLVLDQTAGDASVTLGMTHEDCFQTMPPDAASGSLPRTMRRSPCWPGRMWCIPSPHRWALKPSCSARRFIVSACRSMPDGV